MSSSSHLDALQGSAEEEKVEISAARLAYYEALEAITREIIQPMSQHGLVDAELEREGRFARTWPDSEVRNVMRGSAIWDDPPNGWSEETLLLYSRGYLVGRAIVGGNLGQYYWRFVESLRDPVRYWRRWRLGFLDMCKGYVALPPALAVTRSMKNASGTSVTFAAHFAPTNRCNLWSQTRSKRNTVHRRRSPVGRAHAILHSHH
jgi:hypothetical protein